MEIKRGENVDNKSKSHLTATLCAWVADWLLLVLGGNPLHEIPGLLEDGIAFFGSDVVDDPAIILVVLE